jgi:hypothetical protein
MKERDILWRDTEGNVSIWQMDGAIIGGIALWNVSDRLAQ